MADIGNTLVKTESEYDERIYEAVEAFLDPIVAIGGEFRVSYDTMQQILKRRYVEHALQENPTMTVPALALRTGMTKKDVADVLLQLSTKNPRIVSAEGRVLEFWSKAEGFKDPDTEERLIQARGPGETFQQLVRKALSNTASYNGILDELIAAGSVEIVELPGRPRQVRLLKSSFTASTRDRVKRLVVQSEAIKNFGMTLINNVTIDEQPHVDAGDHAKFKVSPEAASAYELLASTKFAAPGDEKDNPGQMIQRQLWEEVPEPLANEYRLGQKRTMRHCLALMRVYAYAQEAILEEAKKQDTELASAPTVMIGSGFYTFEAEDSNDL